MNVIRMLARVAEAAALSRSLPPEALYNALISDKLDVADHYTAWRQARVGGGVCVLTVTTHSVWRGVGCRTSWTWWTTTQPGGRRGWVPGCVG